MDIRAMPARIPEAPVTVLPVKPLELSTTPKIELPPAPPAASTFEPVSTAQPDSDIVSLIKAVTSPQDGLYISTAPQKEHPGFYEETHPNYGVTIGYRISF